MDCKKLMLCFGRIVTVALLFGCLIELSHGQPKPTEKVKLPLCKSYDTTSFLKANIFNHTSQDEAIFHMHTFSPLISTFCHQELVFFTCMVHFPWYHQEPDSAGEIRTVCSSLCHEIRTGCKFAMSKINFHWPEKISCEKFGNESTCVAKDPKGKPLPSGNQTCSGVLYEGGTPICSSVIIKTPNNKYFDFVNNPFSNYLGHKTQEQAIYELSRHTKLIHLLISQQPDINKTNEVTQCLNDITFLLCNLYLPKCGYRAPRDFPITSSQCRNTLGKNCSTVVQQLIKRGYNVTWPPLDVDCEGFNPISTGPEPQFKKIRTFGGFSPPPPGIKSKSISENFLEIKWNSFPEEYKFGTTVETGILYRKSGSNVQYNHRHTKKNSYVLSGLNASTTYEILVATVNSEAMLPGIFEKIELQTVEGVERIRLGYCSSLYNFTKLPNIFGHQTQDEAIRSIHKIGPLINTACSQDLKALVCSAYLPNYLPNEQTFQPPCQTLCQRVFDKCSYAMSQLKFKWPDDLKCSNLNEKAPCYQPTALPGPLGDKRCTRLNKPSICSLITKPNVSTPYFIAVHTAPFRNHFNHTSQEQAAYELSKHAKLLSLLSTLIVVDKRNSGIHKQCVQKLTYFLCSLYFPNCTGGSEISQNDCKSIVETDREKAGQRFPLVCLDSVERLRFQYQYNIDWPPVRINCDSINSSAVTPKVGYKEIKFQEILPPPPNMIYETIGQSVHLRKQFPQNLQLIDAANGLKILYKRRDIEMPYFHTNHTTVSVTLNIDTSKDYEFFVANLGAKDGMPGYFDRIIYTAGSSVHGLTISCGTYREAVLPNRFGDNLSNALSRLIPFFPLVYTLCSNYLQQFLCSAVFPRYYFGQQQPCRSTCENILDDCSYAISRTKFLWPDEFKCGKFPNQNCFDVITASRSLPLDENEDGVPPRGARSVGECKPTTVEICLRLRDARSISLFKSTFAGGKVNYFNHTSTHQATLELSQHLRLLSVLREYTQRRHRAATECLRYITVFLCHVYVPSCPPKKQPQSLCTTVLGTGSRCFEAVKEFNQMGHDLKWPPVDVNCNDKTWFTPNGTLPAGGTIFSLPPPPPTNIEISRKTTDELSVSFRSVNAPFILQRQAGLLYRQNNSKTSYISLGGQKDSFNIQNLSPATEYEIKVATMDRDGLPGIFRTIISRTFEIGAIEIPESMDICYNYYRITALPNMYGDKTIDTAKLKFFPFYPLVDTFCSSELETFLCSIFLPRYDPVAHVRQRPCREACHRVFESCKYAIGRSRFHWPPELECNKFVNDAPCYNLTKDKLQDKRVPVDEGDRILLPTRRRRAITTGCKATPSTPICSLVKTLPAKGAINSGNDYFKTTVENGNYFNHISTDEAVYEMSKYSNLLSSLAGTKLCFDQLTFLLCHLHLPVCPRSPISQRSCLEFMSNSSSCFIPIKNLNDKGANFNWPLLKVNCQDTKWFSNLTFDTYQPLGTNPFGPSAPVKVQINSRFSTKLGISFQRNGVFNTTTLYRRNGSSTAYQFITQHGTQNPGALSLDQLIPATDYEIKLASLRQISDLPGPFVDIQSNTFGQCQNDTTGDDVAQGKFFWTIQDANTSQVRQCPYGEPPKQLFNGSKTFREEAQRFCKCDTLDVCKNPSWLDPDTTGCQYKNVSGSQLTLTLSEIFQMLDKDAISRQNASEQLLNITLFHAPEFTKDDVALSTLILEEIVTGTDQLNKTGPNIVKTINNILNTAENVLAESQQSSNTSSRIIRVLDEYLESIPLQTGESITQNEENIAVHTQRYSLKNFDGAGAASILEQTTNNFEVYDSQRDISPNISQVSLAMPRSLFKNFDIDKKTQTQRISFVIYRKISFFSNGEKSQPDPKTKTIRKTNSFVISGSVKGQKLSNLSDPIITTYQPLEPGIDETTACVFWNFTGMSGKGDWSQVGCSYQGIMSGIVTCHCTHLTNFAILMDVNIDDRDEAHDKALSIISYIGCAISLVGLILTIITILIFKDLRSKAPTQILLNFCIALSLTLIVFLAAAERSKTSSLTGCRVAAVALHYFVLAVFFWTSVQAYNMYLAFVKVMPSYRAKYILKCCAVGWGIPAIIVIITAAVAIEKYGDEDFCRVKGLAFQVAFLAPVVLILIVNLLAFILIFRSLLSSGSKVAADKKATGWQHARRGSAILTVLGLTWLFGVLAVRDAKLVFQYLFCIFNSVQGLLVFIFYCVLSSETRVKYSKLFCGDKESDTSHGKARYHGSSSEGKFHEINKNKKGDVYTTSTGGSSLSSTNKVNMELNKF